MTSKEDLEAPFHIAVDPSFNILTDKLEQDESPTSGSVKEEQILRTLGNQPFATLSTHRNAVITLISNKIDSYNAVRRELRMKCQNDMLRQGPETNYLLSIIDIRTYYAMMKAVVCSQGFTVALTIMDFLSDLFFCILYLFDIQWALGHANGYIPDYLPGPEWLWIERLSVTHGACIGFSLYNLFSWLIFVSFADNRLKAFFSSLTFITAITSFPFVLSVQVEVARYIYIPYYLRSCIAVDHLRKVLRLRGAVAFLNFGAVVEKTIMLVGTLLVIMYLGQCTFQLVEYRFGGRLINIFDCFYFVVVTLSTVGYGDISPSTKGGQVVVICLILTALTVLPSLISALLATIEETKKGNGGVFTRGQASYFVVLGHFDMAVKISDVLESILHAHSADEKVVILGRSPANHQVQAAITAYQYKDRVTYLVGNGMDKHDLERAQISHATAVYIIPDRGAPDHRKEDEKNTLRAWAIHTYAPDVPLFVNNLLPDTESYQEMNADASLCIDDLKQLVLALTVMYDGASAFLINLLHVSAPDSKYNTLWESQYGDGFGNEMFSVPMNPNFVGMLFNEASWLTFREFQVNMIGVRVYSKLTGLKTLVLNPGSTYKLALEDEVVFLAQEIADIDRFLNMTPTEYQTLVSRSNPKFSSNDTISNVTPSTPYYGTLQRHSISLPRLKSTLKPISHRLASIADFGESCIVMDIPEAPYEDSNVPQCRLRVLPPSFEEQIVESASDWSGHLLICTGDYDVFKFVCGLRAAHLEKHHKILFLAARTPTKAEYSTLSVFPEIHYMVGDPSQKKVLLSAGLRGCHRVILMKFGIYSSGDFAGSAAIMISHLIYHMFQRGEIEQEKCVILEATKRPLINYLHPTPTATQVSYRRLFRSAFKNVGKSVGMNKTLDGGHRRKEKNVPGEVSYFYTPVFAAGRVVAASMLDSVLFQLYKNPSLLETFLMLCGVDKQGKNESPEIMGVKKSWIGQIPLPPGFVNRTYGELYQELALNQGIIPMGLYRQVYPTLRNKLPYVFTNPLSVVLLMEGDIVFVLAP